MTPSINQQKNLKQFLSLQSNIPADLQHLLIAVSEACATISGHVGRGALADIAGGILGSAGSENVQGEVQKKLDIISNDILIEAGQRSGVLAAMASEEMDEILPLDLTSDLTSSSGSSDKQQGNYLLLFDPLDGSSNIEVNVTIGTIFSILTAPKTDATEADFMQPGTRQVAAGYVLYGPQTLLVLTTGDGVNAFTLDRENNVWLLTQEKLSIPADTKEFAINMSNQRHWEAPVQRYISELLAGKTSVRGKDFNMRWVAAMVTDVHRILTRGGIFMYPRDAREPDKPGKLRLMYEANPMSFLVEQAGGASTNGKQRILDLQPTKLHERVAVFLGSKNEVEQVTGYHLE